MLVKEGFCWPAFLFTFLWALWHRLWLAAAGVLVTATAVGILEQGLPHAPLAQALLGLCFSAAVGWLGNDWRRAKLARRGYREWGPVAARDGDEALRRFLDQTVPGPAARALSPVTRFFERHARRLDPTRP